MGTILGFRSRLWVIIGIGAVGCVLLACVGIGLLGRVIDKRLIGDPVSSWAEAASRVQVEVYEPVRLPPGAGAPRIGISRPTEGGEEVRAIYPGGLTIEESNAQRVAGPEQEQAAVEVEGAEDAYFIVEGDQRTLVVNKGGTVFGTWISLSGTSDDELVRIAESLRPLAD